MSDDGNVLYLLAAMVVLALSVGSIYGERVEKRVATDTRCAVHAEYAKNAADTATIVRRLPECAGRYYGGGK